MIITCAHVRKMLSPVLMIRIFNETLCHCSLIDHMLAVRNAVLEKFGAVIFG